MPLATKKVRWGILGTATITHRLLPGFAKAGNAELCALASRSVERARSAAAAAGIPTAYGSYEALLDDRAIDAVYIPLPNALHAEWTMKAAERGKHILCEKPLAPNAEEAQRVVNFCESKGVRLMDGFMWPHHPRTARLKQFLLDGGIGEIRRVIGAFTFPLDPSDTANVRMSADLKGGCLLDVGCYTVFGIRWAFGAEPVSAYATALYRNGVDVEMTGVLRLADGRVGAFDCGFTQPWRGHLEIVGTNGVVWVPELWLPEARASYTIQRAGRPSEEVVFDGSDQIVSMIEGFGRAVLEGHAVNSPPQEAVRTLRVLDALGESARQGREVAVQK
jgi:predicted dehydrogenase